MQHEYRRALNRGSPVFPIDFSIWSVSPDAVSRVVRKLPIFRLKAAVACGNCAIV